MKIPRISVAWIAVLLVAVLFAFLGYNILRVAGEADAPIPTAFSVMPQNQHLPAPQTVSAPIHQIIEEVPLPEVPGQTEEDLQMDEPLQQVPPSVEYGEPSYQDPMEGTVHSSSEFGDNLRHPEQMMEISPPLGSMRLPSAGIGSDTSSQGGNRSIQYAPEMIQNGAEMMPGIEAYDFSDMGGIAYSML